MGRQVERKIGEHMGKRVGKDTGKPAVGDVGVGQARMPKMQVHTIQGVGGTAGKDSDDSIGKNAGEDAVRGQVSKG